MKLDNLKKPFIIAEIGINHEGNFKTAKKLIFNAKMCGADAVKFQVFNPKTLASKKSKKSSFQKKSIGEESLDPDQTNNQIRFPFVSRNQMLKKQ